MKRSLLSRSLAMLLALVMIVGLVPVQIFATETGHDHDHDHEVTGEIVTEPVTEPAEEEAASEPAEEVEPVEKAPQIPEETLTEQEEVVYVATTLQAAEGTGPYQVGTVRYENWADAMAAAAAAETKVVTLVEDVTLVAGEYEVPAGVTLLVPFDEAGTLYTDTPDCLQDENLYTTPVAYRTLTLASGANITVNGAMSLSAPHVPAQGSKKNGGSPTGSYGHVAMEAGSNIVVNSGANLYAWGYVTGSGTVTAKSGSFVHEYFQIMDFRGGSATLGLAQNPYGVFPLNQYYVQNVEVPLVLETGSASKCYTSVKMSGMVLSSGVTFIGNTEDAMFKLTSGKATKYYDGTTDRLMAIVEGNMDISPIVLSMSGMTVNSKFMVLPITNNITIQIKSGNVGITQDVAFFPGSQLIINQGATATLGSDVSVYIYDKDQWGKYAGSKAAEFLDLDFAPGKEYERTVEADIVDAKILVDGILDASNGFLYTTAGGANICSTGTGVIKAKVGTKTLTYQYEYTGTGDNLGIYHEIPVTPAQLRNADGTYLSVTDAEFYYSYANGVWGACTHATTEVIPGTAPTCTEPGLSDGEKCATCGKVLVKQYTVPASCQWGEGTITTQPTCTEDGVRTFTCTLCGATKTEVEPKLGHDIVIDVAVPATCTEDGKGEGQHCTRCDEMTVEQVVIPASGHNEVTDKGYAATCTESGMTDGKHCTTCGAVTVAQETIPALDHDMAPATCTAPATCKRGCGYTEGEKLGHDWDEGVVNKAATCTEPGESLHFCSRCSESETREIPALGHDIVTDAAVAATCTTTGLTEGSHCSRCDAMTVKQEVVPALNHDLVELPAVAATCTETGLTAGEYCTRCDYEVKQTVVDALGHDWGEGTVTTQPTCTEDGVRTFTCSVCGETKTEVEAKLGHDMIRETTKEPTCTEDGEQNGAYCSRCDYEEAGQTIPALGHDWDEGTVTTPATCTDDGVSHHECSRCDATEDRDIPALGHDMADATCTDPATCTRGCGHTEGEALGHDIVTLAAVPATCTEDGKTAGEYCTRCDHEVKQTVVPALGHTRVADPAVPATCTKPGLTAGEHCSVCGLVLEKQEIVPALGHDKVADPAVAATCTEDGLTAGEHCTRCDYKVEQDVIPALGHTEVIDAGVAATCTDAGKTEGKHCSVCGAVTVAQTTIPAKGHVEATDRGYAATCTEDGLTDGKHCSVCNTVLVEQEVIEATGHDMADATCTEPATCRNGCGHTEGEALGHVEVVDYEVPATCEDTGLTEGIHCERCEAILLVQNEIPALGHDIVQVEAKLPTYNSVGWEAYEHCTRCTYTTYVEIPKLEAPSIKTYEDFLENLLLLEEIAKKYVYENPGKDPLALVIKYIRTGVDRYNSGSWGIMAGYEDASFAAYVAAYEDEHNLNAASQEEMITVTAMKNIENFNLPNGDLADLGHVFGTMDITYHNNYSLNHADVAGWAGDTVDLVSLSDQFGVTGTIEEMVTDITNNYLLKPNDHFPEEPIEGAFSETDMKGDLDGYYIMYTLERMDYKCGALTELLKGYFTETLTDEQRAGFLLNNRLGGVSTRSAVRDAVWNAYSGNKMVTTLENTREFNTENLTDLKKACSYAVADYLCRMAGDYVDVTTNPYYSVFSSETSILAPGITQEIKYAMTAQNEQIVYYLATADLPREDIQIYANYKDNDPTVWGMARVLDQANAAQEKYGNPESEYYIENYNVIASINADGYNMHTGEPGGLLVMHGVEYHAVDGGGFFAILKDGTAMIGTQADYELYKEQIQEGVGGFGTTLVKDGEICITATSDYYTNRASRTAVGITRTGKVVFMVLDGRQLPHSAGGSMIEIAQIMLEAGCVHAINLDGGGSTTFVAKQEGADELAVINRPSDGTSRSVSTTLMMVSTAPNSTAFDHAILKASNDYLTVGSSVQVTAAGVSATGNSAELPEGTAWEVSDSQYGSIDANGVFTAVKNGEVEVFLTLDGQVLGSTTLYVVTPDRVYFTRDEMDAIYGSPVELPVKAVYDGNIVAINTADVKMTLNIPEAGTIDGFTFTGNEGSGIKLVTVTAALTADPTATASIAISLYNQGEATFDFDKATGGDRQLAWDRQVSNSTTDDALTYTIVDPDEDMVTSYIFAIDMSKIQMPEVLEDLTYMLPGADMENASAWTFLCQLAERMSDLTEVTATIRFDPNVDVDYSGLTLVNDYFELGKVVAVEGEENTLSVSLNWIKQTEPIDLSMANPICILSGLKLTPKDDAQWNAKDQLNVVNKGEISYTVYMRANALYSFALKPENQERYGLYPYVHPENENERGGCFSSTYKTFQDSYTLIKAVKNGWYNEDGGFTYYENGVRYTGVQEVDGYYYDFGENGVNVGQTKYTGIFAKDGKTFCALNGLLVTGWQQINGAYYCFNGEGGAALTGEQTMTIDGEKITYVFADDGELTTGVWVIDSVGRKYFYGPACHRKGWQLIDGKSYFFENKYCYIGYNWIRDSNSTVAQWYDFGEDGALVGPMTMTGLLWVRGEVYYLVDGVSQYGLQKVNGYFYYFRSNNCAGVRDGDFYLTNLNGYNYTIDNIQIGTYHFDAEGRMTDRMDVQFIAASLSLKGDIGLNFYVKLSGAIRADETAYMQFTIGNTVKTVPLNEGIYDSSDGSYRFSMPVNAKNMGDDVTAQVYNADGFVCGSKTLSVKYYADYVVANSSKETFVNLMTAMLNYGAAAQTEFGYKTDALVNADLDAADRVLPGNVDVSEYAHSITGTQEGITITSASLLLQSETKIRIYFELDEGKSIEDFTFTINGEEVTPVLSASGEYYLEKANVAAKDLDTMYTFTLGDITVKYCGLSYVNQVVKYSTRENLLNLAKALYAYNQAANAYFGA